MRILFTGASSFTGFWFARELALAGHELFCPLRGRPEAYTGIRRHRIEQLESKVCLLPATPFGAEGFIDLASGTQWDLVCHHASEVGNYKADDFNVQAALENNTRNLPAVLRALKAAGAPVVLLTGTVFESGEGQGDEPLRAFSPYGLSKTLTWEMFLFYCARAELPLGKFVIPNPFGPWEEERFTSYLMKSWRAGQSAVVKTPDYIRDNIPVDLLAKVYRSFAENLATTRPALAKINPSGYVSDQGAFAQRIAREIRPRSGWDCHVEIVDQQTFLEPRRRVNSDPAVPLAPGWNEAAFWSAFFDFYSK